jgi:hypothetical protein
LEKVDVGFQQGRLNKRMQWLFFKSIAKVPLKYCNTIAGLQL